ncbi:MAG TPA: hypothetical protein VF017_15585 [Thermoanaerobaculia bacterium]|nr:hypothetical protein [Thermoanaerobaculia bacterium]
MRTEQILGFALADWLAGRPATTWPQMSSQRGMIDGSNNHRALWGACCYAFDHPDGEELADQVLLWQQRVGHSEKGSTYLQFHTGAVAAILLRAIRAGHNVRARRARATLRAHLAYHALFAWPAAGSVRSSPPGIRVSQVSHEGTDAALAHVLGLPLRLPGQWATKPDNRRRGLLLAAVQAPELAGILEPAEREDLSAWAVQRVWSRGIEALLAGVRVHWQTKAAVLTDGRLLAVAHILGVDTDNPRPVVVLGRGGLRELHAVRSPTGDNPDELAFWGELSALERHSEEEIDFQGHFVGEVGRRGKEDRPAIERHTFDDWRGLRVPPALMLHSIEIDRVGTRVDGRLLGSRAENPSEPAPTPEPPVLAQPPLDPLAAARMHIGQAKYLIDQDPPPLARVRLRLEAALAALPT